MSEAETNATAAAEAAEAARLSALDENIEKKGKNSYYYAHSLKANGPAWDGKEEPRLLAVTPLDSVAAEQKVRRKRREFESYSWMDGKKIVKIFVDHSDPESVDDERITINWTENSVEFIIADGDIDLYFHAGPLSEGISGVTHKRKSDSFVLVLNKAVESSWYQLKKAP